MTPEVKIPLAPNAFVGTVAELIKRARASVGWSREELASRANTSPTRIWRLETADPAAFELGSVDRVLCAMGLRLNLEIHGLHLAEREAQRDLVHAAAVAALAGRLRRAGWRVIAEVPTGALAPTGWMDIVAYRPSDNAVLVIEVKTAIPDAGDVMRQVTRYEIEAPWAAMRQGWQPSLIRVALVVLDTQEATRTVAANRELFKAAFTGRPQDLAAWILDPGVPPPAPAARTLAMMDLWPRRGPGLLLTPLSGRRSEPAYTDYAAAAMVLRQRRASPGTQARRRREPRVAEPAR